MNKSKRRYGFLLILWVCFTAKLSQRVELFPQEIPRDTPEKIEVRTRILDSLQVPQEIRFLPASAQHYTVMDAD